MLVHGMWHFFTSARVSKLWWSRLKNRQKNDHGEQTDMDKKATLKDCELFFVLVVYVKLFNTGELQLILFGANYIVFFIVLSVAPQHSRTKNFR